MSKKMHHCLCGGDVEIRNVSLNGGMDGGYQNWEIFCKKCGGSWQWAADGFYGREYYSKDEVIDLWNDTIVYTQNDIQTLRQIKDLCDNAGDLCENCPFRTKEPCVCILDLPPCDWDLREIVRILRFEPK